jgi:hypothetical protein
MAMRQRATVQWLLDKKMMIMKTVERDHLAIKGCIENKSYMNVLSLEPEKFRFASTRPLADAFCVEMSTECWHIEHKYILFNVC